MLQDCIFTSKVRCVARSQLATAPLASTVALKARSSSPWYLCPPHPSLTAGPHSPSLQGLRCQQCVWQSIPTPLPRERNLASQGWLLILTPGATLIQMANAEQVALIINWGKVEM